jgi:hypothetical protein
MGTLFQCTGDGSHSSKLARSLRAVSTHLWWEKIVRISELWSYPLHIHAPKPTHSTSPPFWHGLQRGLFRNEDQVQFSGKLLPFLNSVEEVVSGSVAIQSTHPPPSRNHFWKFWHMSPVNLLTHTLGRTTHLHLPQLLMHALVLVYVSEPVTCTVITQSSPQYHSPVINTSNSHRFRSSFHVNWA